VEIYLYSLIYIPLFALVGWLISLIIGDASVADVLWGPGFVGLAWMSWALTEGSIIIPILVTIWGLRLGIHIGIRNSKKKSDFRYEKMRLQNPRIWWWWSFFKVFLLQAFLMWVIGLVVIEGSLTSLGDWINKFYLSIGVVIALLGFAYESVADYQLSRFKSRQKNNEIEQGSVLDTGLWRFSRHPNYFGEMVFWWGIFITTVSFTGSYWTVVSPLLISFLLLKVSGVTMLEKGMIERKPAYTEYIKNTPSFFPRFWD